MHNEVIRMTAILRKRYDSETSHGVVTDSGRIENARLLNIAYKLWSLCRKSESKVERQSEQLACAVKKVIKPYENRITSQRKQRWVEWHIGPHVSSTRARSMHLLSRDFFSLGRLISESGSPDLGFVGSLLVSRTDWLTRGFCTRILHDVLVCQFVSWIIPVGLLARKGSYEMAPLCTIQKHLAVWLI